MDLITTAAILDREDPLAGYRGAFHLPREVYLKGNSLGAMPKAARQAVESAMRTWETEGVRGWNQGWYELPERLGAKIAPLIGVDPTEVVVCDSTTLNLAKLVAAWDAQTWWSDKDNFPSDLYAVGGLARLGLFREIDEVPDGQPITLSHVHFRSGRRLDMAAITRRARAKGCPIVWDLSHSAGVVPIDLAGADAAIGCTYKYLHGGPGAPAYIVVRGAIEPRLRGWFGHADPFAFDLDYRPDPGARRWLVSTPPVLSMVACEPGLDLLNEVGPQALAEKAARLMTYAYELAKDLAGFQFATPPEPEARGAHLALVHPEAHAINLALGAEHGVIADFRAPDTLRLGFAPLTTRFQDISIAMRALARVTEERAFERHRPAGQKVT